MDASGIPAWLPVVISSLSFVTSLCGLLLARRAARLAAEAHGWKREETERERRKGRLREVARELTDLAVRKARAAGSGSVVRVLTMRLETDEERAAARWLASTSERDEHIEQVALDGDTCEITVNIAPALSRMIRSSYAS